jgi:hypothetical protein
MTAIRFSGREQAACDQPDGTCSAAMLPPTVDQARRALSAAGLTQLAIRTARAHDPAPAGSLLIAVPAGRACVLVFHAGSDMQSAVAGRLPDGTCLST